MKIYDPPYPLAWYYSRGLNGLGKSRIQPTKTMEAVMIISIERHTKEFRQRLRRTHK